jgi:hypothetical protein
MERYPNVNILLNLPERYIPKAEFVLRTYCYILRLNPKFIYGAHYEAAHVYYGPQPARDYPIMIHFDPATAEFFEIRELYPLDRVNFCMFNGNHLPFLFSSGGAIFSFTQESCILRKDIVAGGFYFLTCWHEYIISNLGLPRGRVDYKESLQYRWDFTETPVVDIYCQVLLYGIQRVLPEFNRDIAWQENKKFAVSLSHDIDYWRYWDTKTINDTYKYNLQTFLKRPLNASYKLLGHYLHKRFIYNHYQRLRKILQKEQDLNVRSTWFLLAGAAFADPRQNYIADMAIREEIIDLLGQEDVGLHGSPESAYDPDILNAELNRLRELGFNPTGFRTHYLHFDYQKSFANLEAAGIKYDSTLGYWENIGFRAGISVPFYPFNIAENRPFRVLEIPLIVMDTTLYSHKAMNMSPNAGKRALKRLIAVAAKYQSHLSLLWHNTSFDPVDYPGWGRLYWKTIRRALRSGAWVSSLKEIYEEWVNLSY